VSSRGTVDQQATRPLVDLRDKVALVVGSSAGIGAATARLFAELGAAVVLASRDVEAIHRIAGEIDATGGHAAAIRTDVSADGDVEAAVALAVDQFGGLDIAVNNAGVQGPARPLTEQSNEDFHRIVDINLRGVWRALRAELPAILERGGGAIVNTASVGGLVGASGIAPYCASKHGVIGLTKSAALDYAPQVRINVVAPGAIDTAMFNDWMTDAEARERMVALHPLGRVGAPSEVAATIAWLCSEASSYVTGAVIPVDGGYTIS
jgi:NAD(P)-dependent dehydrogenase (short-subunit alcohol dehydrogenase family)